MTDAHRASARIPHHQFLKSTITNASSPLMADDAPDTIVAAVKEREARKAQLVADLAALDTAYEIAAVGPEVRQEAQDQLRDWRGLLAKQVVVSRQALRKLLGPGRFTFYPMKLGRERYYELGVQPSLEKFFATLPALKKAVTSPTGFEPVFWP